MSEYVDVIIPPELQEGSFWRLYPKITESTEEGKFIEIKWGDNKVDTTLEQAILLVNDLNKIIEKLSS